MKNDRSKNWFVRVDGPEDFLRQKSGEVAKWIDTKCLMSMYHVGSSKENPHCHMCLELHSDLQKQSLDVRIKKLFDVKGSQYSSVVWDGIRNAGAGAYLFHEEEARILHKVGWSDSDISQAKAHNESVKAVVAVNKQRASTKLPTRALEHFKGLKPDRYEVLEWMLKEIRDGNAYHPGNYGIKRYVEEVTLKLTDKDDFHAYVQATYHDLWRN